MPAPGRTTAALAALLLAWSAAGQGWDGDWGQGWAGWPGASQPGLTPGAVTGRDFAGLRLPVEAGDGPISLGANRVRAWTEPGRRLPDGTRTEPVTRLLLAGDVTARLGIYEFHAARALVWLQALPADDQGGPEPAPPQEGGATAYQFFIYFDRLGTPTVQAGLGVSGDRVPVQGVLRPPEGIRLRYDVLEEGRVEDGFVREGERALGMYLRSLVSPADPRYETLPEEERLWPRRLVGPPRPGESRPYQLTLEPPSPEELALLEEGLPPARYTEPIFAEDGVFAFSFGEATLEGHPEESYAVLTGGITVQYWRPGRVGEEMFYVTAETAVVFFAPGTLIQTLQSMSAEDVHGLYLEGAVLAEYSSRQPRRPPVNYNVRSPRMYYDVRTSRAVMLDAVFWTHDQARDLPIYLRAGAIRQEAQRQFRAERATLTNTAFARPHLSIGVSSVTIRGRDRRDGGDQWLADARNITLRAGPVPVLYFPRYAGDPTRIPVRDVRFEGGGGTGGAVRTEWEPFSLLGLERPPGLRARLLADYYFQRGPGVGARTSWGDEGSRGGALVYTVPDDTGRDLMQSGARIDREGEFRGIAMGEHRQEIDRRWSLALEGFHVSDEGVVPTFFPGLARASPELTNRAYLRRLDESTMLTMQAKGSFNDFTPNEYLLQSQGYTVQKLPEVFYTRLADDVLGDSSPGLLTWHSEYRASRLRMEFTEPTARELGYTNNFRAQRAFGVQADESIADRLRSEGFTETDVHRLDTRHEVSAQLEAGPVNITPFAVGRLTFYDNRFEDFSPDERDRVRAFGAAGTRFWTSIQRIDDTVESRLFDLHRVRHIVEPSATVWHAGSTIDRADLPVYDEDVESLATGSAVRFGIDQTWQTQRGGPGRWRSVDVFTLSTHMVFASADVDRRSTLGRFFEDRPELSILGDFATADATWQVSDMLALVGGTLYSFDLDQPARTTAGFVLRHTPELVSTAEIRYLNAHDTTFYNIGSRYTLTDKYTLGANATFDGDRARFQAAGADLRRRFPNVVVGLNMHYNDIANNASFGFSFEPVGVEDRAARLRGLGTVNERARQSAIGG